MLIALVAMFASAETYNYLKFTKTNGSTVTYSVEGLKLTYDNTNVTITNAEARWPRGTWNVCVPVLVCRARNHATERDRV